MKRTGLTAFFVLAFGYPWCLGILYALFPAQLIPILGKITITNPIAMSALCAPSLAAIIVAAFQGRGSLGDLFGRLFRWRIGLQWYLAPALGIAAIGLSAQFVSTLVFHTPPPSFSLAQGPQLLLLGLISFFPGPIGEELGWRGFVLPRLVLRMRGLNAALILGVIWALWHIPGFLIPGMPETHFPFWSFLVCLVAVSVILAWMVGEAHGSLIPALLGHWAFNCFINLRAPAATLTALFFAVAAAGVVAYAASGRSAPIGQGVIDRPAPRSSRELQS